MEAVTAPDKMFSSSRRSHRKTRTGCNNCKRRKIKCGEGKPSCLNCIKHSIPCDYSHANALAAKSAAVGAGASASLSPGSPADQDDANPASQSQPPGLSLMDMEVFHHFCTSTALDINSDPEVKELWRTTIPGIACGYEFLMRSLLAFASLHLARLRPSQREKYYTYSLLQHQTALQQATIVLPNTTSETCAPLHIFTILTNMHTLAHPRSLGEFTIVGESGIAQWLVLFRGTTAIIDQFKSHLETGCLAPLFRARTDRITLRESYATSDHTSYLSPLLSLIHNSALSPSEIAIYTDAILGLERSYKFMHNCSEESYETGDIFVWLFRLSDAYLMRLRDGAQEALAVFAFSCVLFKRLERFWWIEGWSAHVMGGIYGFLDEEHREWIVEPIREIGWVRGK
ncbi:hypothetical protein ACMFMG_007725 [Clarireedia jacksonii]